MAKEGFIGITVSRETWKRLTLLKVNRGDKTMDLTIRHLFLEAGLKR